MSYLIWIRYLEFRKAYMIRFSSTSVINGVCIIMSHLSRIEPMGKWEIMILDKDVMGFKVGAICHSLWEVC